MFQILNSKQMTFSKTLINITSFSQCMVAVELYRAVTAWNDIGHGTFSLHFIKNKEQQEVDFIIANEGEPLILIEAKLSDTKPSPVLKKFQSVLKKPADNIEKFIVDSNCTPKF